MKTFLSTICIAALMAGGAAAEHHGGKKEMTMETPELTGVFSGDGWVATFLAKGILVGVDAETSAVFVVGKYGAKDGVFWFKDIVAPAGVSEEQAKCGEENKGKYNYAIDGDTVTFSLVEDPCANRAEEIDGTVLTRVAMPAPEASEE